MAVHVDTSKDHEVLAEAPESILYGSKSDEKPPEVADWVQLDFIEVFPIDKTRMTTDSLLAEMDSTVRMSKDKAKGIIPKNDDLWKRIKDGTFWRVMKVDVVSFGNEYRLHCKRSTKR